MPDSEIDKLVDSIIGDSPEDGYHEYIHEDNKPTKEFFVDKSADATLAEVNKRIDEANKQIDKLVDDFKAEIQDVRKNITSEFKDVRKEVDDSKGRVVETLALFAALFTFLSLQVQIFSGDAEPNIILSTLLITGGLITFFVLILDLIIKTSSEVNKLARTRFIILFTLSIAMIVCGYFTMFIRITPI